jgi:hypothetical protein
MSSAATCFEQRATSGLTWPGRIPLDVDMVLQEA